MNNNEQKGFRAHRDIKGIVSAMMAASLLTFSCSASYADAAFENSQLPKTRTVKVKSAATAADSTQSDKANSGQIASNNPAQVKTEKTSQTGTADSSTQDEQDDDGQSVAADTGTPAEDGGQYSKDPLEKFNRAMFTFNDKFDTYLLKPIATFYNTIMPKPLNQGIHNFFNNLGELPTIANDLLQFNFYQMTSDLWRFGINTTLGIGGLFDIATRMNIPYFQNDFGLTLAYWGYQDSSYLVLPFLGSNTIRDGIGIPVDYFEFSVYPYVQPQSRRYQVLGLFFIDHRANLLQFEPVLEEAAVDKYVF